MSIPFYVNPETVVREKAEFARKNIARGRPIVALEIQEGVLVVCENPSSHLRKIAELYDRIAFAGVGKYNEFESLRIAGVRLADMKGYSYHREDVTAKSLANAYAQTLGSVFTNDLKPFEVELMVAQVGESSGEPNEIYHVDYAGYVSDEHGFMAMGGEADELRERLERSFEEGLDTRRGLSLAVQALARDNASPRPKELEVALLASSGGRRRFQRFSSQELSGYLED
jgi:proteasome alpha subunit